MLEFLQTDIVRTVALWALLVEIGILAICALFTNKGLFGYIFTTIHIFLVVIIVRLLFFDATFLFWQMAVMVGFRAFSIIINLFTRQKIGSKIANIIEHLVFGGALFGLYYLFYMVA